MSRLDRVERAFADSASRVSFTNVREHAGGREFGILIDDSVVGRAKRDADSVGRWRVPAALPGVRIGTLVGRAFDPHAATAKSQIKHAIARDLNRSALPARALAVAVLGAILIAARTWL